MHHVVFGFNTLQGEHEQDYGSAFKEKSLRIPRILLKNNTSVIQSMLTKAQDTYTPPELPLTVYVQTTNEALAAQIIEKEQQMIKTKNQQGDEPVPEVD